MAERGNNRDRKRLRVKQRGGVEETEEQWLKKPPDNERLGGGRRASQVGRRSQQRMKSKLRGDGERH